MENHPCFKVFSEINFHNIRLAVLGVEAKKVLDVMKLEGMASEVLEPLYEEARKAAGLEFKTTQNVEGKEGKRCKW